LLAEIKQNLLTEDDGRLATDTEQNLLKQMLVERGQNQGLLCL